MPATLIIGWDKLRILAVSGEAGPSGVRVAQFAEFELPPESSPQVSPESAGKLLRKQLDKAGIEADAAVIALPREDAVIRYLELPNVPDEELPPMVRLQAATKSAFSVDQLLIDFIPLPSVHNSDQRRVLLATMPKTLSETIRRTLQAANLELKGIGLAAVGLAELGSRLVTPAYGKASLILSLGVNRLELALVQNTNLLATHAVAVEAEKLTPQVIQAEINRLLIASQQKLGEIPLGAVAAICSPDQAGLAEGLRGRYGEMLHVVDPLVSSLVHLPGAIASESMSLPVWSVSLGVLLNRESGRLGGVDFLSPRKVVPKKDTRPIKYGAIAGGAVAVIALIYFLFQSHLSKLDQQISDLKDQRSELEATIKAGADTLKTGNELDQWLARDFQLVEELDRFQQELPGTDVALLSEFRFAVNNSKLLAEFTAKGIATDRQVVEETQRNFALRGFKVPPQSLGTSRRESGYPVAFDLELDLAPPEPATPVKKTR